MAKAMIFHVICPSLCRFMQLIKKLNIDYVSSELRIFCENEIYRKQTSGSSVSGGTPWYARNSLCLCKAWLARVFCKRLGLIFGEIWVLKLVFEVVQKCDIGLNHEIMKYRIIIKSLLLCAPRGKILIFLMLIAKSNDHL